MKLKKYIYSLFAAAIVISAQSCFQDMDDNPPFDYPEEPEAPAPEPDASGRFFNMSFDEGYVDAKSGKSATVVGNPGTAAGKEGNAYAGAADSYLTFNTADFIEDLGDRFSIAFWYKVNANPDRAGIISISAVTAGADAAAQNNRNFGIRLFREGSATSQTIKGNLGTGTTDVWVDGIVIDANSDWVHIAMTVGGGSAVLYLDGKEAKSAAFEAVNWEGCDMMSIASGAPRFNEWNHLSDLSLIDELGIYNKALSATEIATIMAVKPALDISGQVFYAPFNSGFNDTQSGAIAAKIGEPVLAAGKAGQAYAGATDSYLTFNTADLSEAPGSEFSISFWYKVNGTPDRAGIIVIGPETEGADPNAQNNRNAGIRIFRENLDGKQIIKGNVGTGAADVWVDGGAAATVDPADPQWAHVAFVITPTNTLFYLNGEVAKDSALEAPVSWEGCDLISIGSGYPRFTEWGHASDLSLIDEVRMYNKALTAEEIAKIIAY